MEITITTIITNPIKNFMTFPEINFKIPYSYTIKPTTSTIKSTNTTATHEMLNLEFDFA